MALKPNTTLTGLRPTNVTPDVDALRAEVDIEVSSNFLGAHGLDEGFGGFHVETPLAGRTDESMVISIDAERDFLSLRAAFDQVVDSPAAKASFMERFTALYATLSPAERRRVKAVTTYLDIPIQRVSTHHKDRRAIGAVPN